MNEKVFAPDPKDRTAGVYRLTCVKTGRFYVGSSARVGRRAWTHLSHMRRGVHHSPALQQDYSEHGPDAFVFSIIKECDKVDLQRLEQEQIDAVLGMPGCCNTSSRASGFGDENVAAAAAGRAKSAKWLAHAAKFAELGKDEASVRRRVEASLASPAFHENSRRQG